MTTATGVLPCPERRFSRIELWRRELPAHFRGFLDRPFTAPDKGTPAQISATRRLLGRLEKARDYWRNQAHRGIGIALIGEVGSGKTHLAMKFAEAYVGVTGTPVAVMSESEYLAAFSATKGGMDGFGGDEYFKARNARALFLDDLGSSRYTDARAGDLTDLIVQLHRRRVMLIWTSNVPLHGESGLEGRGILDPRAVSRLNEMGIPMSTEGLSDWRLGNQEKLLTDFAGVK